MTLIAENCVRVSAKQVTAALDICLAWNFKENTNVNIFQRIFEKTLGPANEEGWDQRYKKMGGTDGYYLLDPEDANKIRIILGPYSNVYLRMWFNEVEGQTGGES